MIISFSPFCFCEFRSSLLSLLWILFQVVCLFLLHLCGLVSFYLILHLHYISLSFLFFILTPFEVFLSQALGLVYSFFLSVSAFWSLPTTKWFVLTSFWGWFVTAFQWEEVFSFFPLRARAVWGGIFWNVCRNSVCWWLVLCFCLACCLGDPLHELLSAAGWYHALYTGVGLCGSCH